MCLCVPPNCKLRENKNVNIYGVGGGGGGAGSEEGYGSREK